MRYAVVLTDEVKAKLRSLPLTMRREIGHKLFVLEEDLRGGVKKLTARATNTGCAEAITASFSNSKAEPRRCLLWATEKTFIDQHRCPEAEIPERE